MVQNFTAKTIDILILHEKGYLCYSINSDLKLCFRLASPLLVLVLRTNVCRGYDNSQQKRSELKFQFIKFKTTNCDDELFEEKVFFFFFLDNKDYAATTKKV